MNLITNGSLEVLRQDYQNTLHDVCVISCSASGINSYGEPSTETISGSPIPCALYQNGGIKNSHGQMLKTDSDAVLRLSLDTVINLTDKVSVTSLYGSSTSLVYTVNSEPVSGLIGKTVELKRTVT